MMQPDYAEVGLVVCPNCNTLYDPEAHTDKYTQEIQCPGCSAHVNLLE
jgi:uncharacterized Zn-finger protein